ncbi:dienelactone hydrolase family protein [Nautilia lithotrophica]
MHKNIVLSILITIILTGCFGIKPEQMEEYTYVEYPEFNSSKYPVVFFFPNSSGSNNNGFDWCQWYEKYGFACVFINSKAVRHTKNLMKTDYARDLSVVLDVVKKDKKLDLNNYIVMGFSKGGTMAMKSGSYLRKDQPKPKLVFALYPGGFEGCPNSYEKPTEVFIFYGDKDEWGAYRGIRENCKDTANQYKNVYFYLLKNAHHGYDGSWAGGFNCCGGFFKTEPNEKALEKTREIILEQLKKFNFIKEG